MVLIFRPNNKHLVHLQKILNLNQILYPTNKKYLKNTSWPIGKEYLGIGSVHFTRVE